MNDLLRKLYSFLYIEKLSQTFISTYSDDLVSLISNDSKIELHEKVDLYVRMMSQWCDEPEVKLNVSKTEVINLSANNLKEKLEINLNAQLVVMKSVGMIIF